LISDLLQYDSTRRPTAAQALQYRFFDSTSNQRPLTTRVAIPSQSFHPTSTKADAKEDILLPTARKCQFEKRGDEGNLTKRYWDKTCDDPSETDAKDMKFHFALNMPRANEESKQHYGGNNRLKHPQVTQREFKPRQELIEADSVVNESMLQDLLDEVMC